MSEFKHPIEELEVRIECALTDGSRKQNVDLGFKASWFQCNRYWENNSNWKCGI